MTMRTTFDYATERYEQLRWKDKLDDCPNCLGLGAIVREVRDKENYWSDCPCCTKTFATLRRIEKRRRAA
jgi:hypothetical protein